MLSVDSNMNFFANLYRVRKLAEEMGDNPAIESLKISYPEIFTAEAEKKLQFFVNVSNQLKAALHSFLTVKDNSTLL
jgi:hypothetical protein